MVGLPAAATGFYTPTGKVYFTRELEGRLHDDGGVEDVNIRGRGD